MIETNKKQHTIQLAAKFGGVKTYFPALDILRFVAATVVMLSHVELVLQYRGMSGFMTDSFLYESGKAGVSVFFALSGFLLAKISIEEKEKFNGIDLKLFFKKRALRILPLYYFLTIVAFFILPHFSTFYVAGSTEEMREFFNEKLMLYLLMLPQFNEFFFQHRLPATLQFWTIGCEVVFYLILPFLIRANAPLKKLIVAMVLFTLVKFFLRIISGNTPYENVVAGFFHILHINRIDCMLLGAIGALMMHQKHSWAISLSSRDNMIFGTGMIVVMLFFHRRFINGFDYALYAVAIVPYLLHFTTVAKNQSSNMAVKILAFGGRISYSIYLLHFMVLLFVWYFLYDFTLLTANQFVWAINLLGPLVVYALATLTYFIIERPFLKLKGKTSST